MLRRRAVPRRRRGSRRRYDASVFFLLVVDLRAVVGSNAGDDARAERIAAAAARLLDEAGSVATGRDGELAQLEAATRAGSVFVVHDGERRIAATTRPEPTVGLVFYDLKSCLRSLEDEKPKRTGKKADAS